MAILRPAFSWENFTPLRNVWLRDARISLKAKGLLGYLMSHERGYRCSQAQMVRESSDGRDAIVSAREELAAAGYLRRIPNRSSGGRFAEDDYELTDPFDEDGKLLADRSGSPAGSAPDSRGKSDRVGKPVPADPVRSARRIEDQGENTTGGTTSHAASGDAAAGQLELVDGEPPLTEGQRAHRIATTYANECGGMVRFMAVRNVVALAVKARPPSTPDGYPDERILAALRALRARGRSITAEALHDELEGIRRASSNGHAPHRDSRGANYAANL